MEEAREADLARAVHREMVRTVRVAVSRVKAVHREIVLDREEAREMARTARAVVRREMEEVREADLARADHRAKAARRDSARIPERMMTWYLHLN